MVSALETIISQTAFDVCFQFQLAAVHPGRFTRLLSCDDPDYEYLNSVGPGTYCPLLVNYTHFEPSFYIELQGYKASYAVASNIYQTLEASGPGGLPRERHTFWPLAY